MKFLKLPKPIIALAVAIIFFTAFWVYRSAEFVPEFGMEISEIQKHMQVTNMNHIIPEIEFKCDVQKCGQQGRVQYYESEGQTWGLCFHYNIVCDVKKLSGP